MSISPEQAKDLQLGVWIRGRIYYYVGKKRFWVNVPAKVLKCMNHPLFQNHKNKSVPAKKYCEGRRCYIDMKAMPSGKFKYATPERLLIAGDNQLALEVYQQLDRIKGKRWSMSHLICGSIKDPIEDLLKGECTEVGALISRSLIRTAATRIFNQPEQSIMELVVNSIDSYFPEKSVGKFGMGFFSFLYWLIESNAVLYITSFCVDSQNRTYAYTVTISYDSEFVFQIEPLISYTRLTGTRIELKPKTPFEYQSLNSFRGYVDGTKYVKGVEIKELQSTNDAFIHVKIKSEVLEVEDYATGITLDVLLTKLFIPSVSTKTIQASKRSTKTKLVQVAKPIWGYSSICVNDIVVVRFYQYYEHGCSGHFIWNLPGYTKLPVSRDDVFLEMESATETLGDLIDASISINTFITLQKTLKEYMSRTSISSNVTIINDIMDKKVKLWGNVLIPLSFGIKHFLPEGVFSEVFDADRVRKTLIEKLDSNEKCTKINAFYGKEVYAVKDLPPPTEGIDAKDVYFTDIIIVDYKLTLNHGWDLDFSTTYFKQGKLIPTSTPIRDENLLSGYSTLGLSKKAKIMVSTILDLLHGCMSIHNVIFDVEKEIQSCVDLYKLCGKYAYQVFDVIAQALKNISPRKSYEPIGYRIFGQKLAFDRSAPRDEKFARMLTQYMIEQLKFAVDNDWPRWITTKLQEYLHMTYYETFKYLVDRVDSSLYLDYMFYILRLCFVEKQKLHLFFDVIYKKVQIRNPDLGLMMNCHENDNSIVPEDKALQMFVQDIFSKDATIIPRYMHPNEYHGQVISNVKLINFLFEHPGKLKYEDLAKLKSWEPTRDLKLQALEIAVNEGTTRPFIEAVLTECFQNSVDAIRKFNPPNRAIVFGVARKDDHLILSIDDHVGMSVESFLYISVPFLSTKNDKDPAYTGEMGTGFFNVYRESSMVRIMTRPPDSDMTYIWEDIPVRKEGRVIDINKKFVKTDLFNARGTRIEIHMPYSDVPQNDPMIKDFSHYSEMISLITRRFWISFLDIGIGKSDTPKPLFITSIGKIEFYMVFDKEITSFIYTNGIPFAPLKGTSHEVLNRVIINILPGGYIPRQSRNYLDLGTNQKDFDKIVDIAKQYTAMHSQMDSSSPFVFDQSYGSNSDIKSVLPNRSNDGEPRSLQYCFPGQQSIASYLHEAAKVCNYSPDVTGIKLLLEWLQKTFDVQNNQLDIVMSNYIYTWIISKSPPLTVEYTRTTAAAGIEEPYLTLLTDIYVDLAQKNKIYGFNSKVKAISLPNKGRSFSNGKDIFISQASEPEIKQAFDETLRGYSQIKQGLWFDIFKPIGTFTHEMEHVRRHSSTVAEDGDHDVIRTPLWEGDTVKERTFEKCQVDVYLKLVEAGLWKKFDEEYARLKLRS